MKTKLLLPFVLALLTATMLSSCGSHGSRRGRGDGHSGGMSSWERSRR